MDTLLLPTALNTVGWWEPSSPRTRQRSMGTNGENCEKPIQQIKTPTNLIIELNPLTQNTKYIYSTTE